MDLCCLQDIRWRGASAHMREGKDSRYKMFWAGNEKGRGSVGILLSEEWTEKVFDIKRVSDCTVMIKLAIDNKIITALSCYAPCYTHAMRLPLIPPTEETLPTCVKFN